MSTNEVTLRKQAVQKWLTGEPKSHIARDLGEIQELGQLLVGALPGRRSRKQLTGWLEGA
jgi:hypothetical protein